MLNLFTIFAMHASIAGYRVLEFILSVCVCILSVTKIFSKIEFNESKHTLNSCVCIYINNQLVKMSLISLI